MRNRNNKHRSNYQPSLDKAKDRDERGFFRDGHDGSARSIVPFHTENSLEMYWVSYATLLRHAGLENFRAQCII